MRRRAFTAGLGAAAIWPLAAGAQHRQRISILHSGYPRRTAIHLLFEALSKLGYEDGRTEIDPLGQANSPSSSPPNSS